MISLARRQVDFLNNLIISDIRQEKKLTMELVDLFFLGFFPLIAEGLIPNSYTWEEAVELTSHLLDDLDSPFTEQKQDTIKTFLENGGEIAAGCPLCTIENEKYCFKLVSLKFNE